MSKAYARVAQTIMLSFVLLFLLPACDPASPSSGSGSSVILNVGYFANLTHAVALVGVGDGLFKKDLPTNVMLKSTTFNAGPAEIQALLAGSIDIAFAGPSPSISGYTESHDAALKVIAGASSGGVEFVVQANEHINSAADLVGKKIADPQEGGTQDVALRNYLKQHGLKPSDQGGNVQIISTANANILSLFKAGRIDGAWMPEPWATRLVVEGKGKVFLNEKSLWPNGQFATTIVVVRQAFYTAHPAIVKDFLVGEVDTVAYIAKNPTQAATIANNEIGQITGSPVKGNELMQAFDDLTLTYDPLASSIAVQAQRAYALGFVSSNPDLSQFYNLAPLNAVLTAKGLPTVSVSTS